MTTTTRPAILGELVNLDPCGVRRTEEPARPSAVARLPGLRAEAFLATVQRIEPARHVEALAWGVADRRTVLFRVSEATIREMQAALAAGEEPTAIVEPCQVVSLDL